MTVRLQTVGRVATLALALLLAPLAVAALQAGKVYRVGILGENAADPSEARLWQTFRLALRERGWSEGENLRIESRWVEGNAARLPALAAELVRLKVDLIVTRGSIYVQGAQQATASIPIVFLSHADPVGTGHVASLARPGGHITGLAVLHTELSVKGLEFLRAAVPEATRIAVLWNPETPSHTPALTALEEAARTLQVQLQPVAARSGAELEDAFAAMARAHAQAVVVLGFGPYIAARQRLAEVALRDRLPTVFTWREHVEAGGLMSYGPHQDDLFRRGAIYVDKILRGAKPADLPVEQPMQFEFVINLKTAKELGLTIPPVLLFQATEVIQ
jgi:putative tryptophan/tyrosine transport system substrate-binding protein